MRHQVKVEARHVKRTSNDNGDAPADHVGKCSSGNVSKKNDYQVPGADQVDVKLIEPARAQEQRIDREDERRAEAVKGPHHPVAASDRANRGLVRGGLAAGYRCGVCFHRLEEFGYSLRRESEGKP
jgi:hypothetical protein